MGCKPSCIGGSSEDTVQEFYANARLAGAGCVVNNTAVVKRRSNDELKSINNFRVVKPLGKGQYGEVYLARAGTGKGRCWGAEQEDFALKVVSRAGTMSVEYKVLIKVQHQNIVRMVEYIDDRTHDDIYLVFEVLDKPIAVLQRDGHLLNPKAMMWTQERAVKLFMQMVEAVIHLHSVGVIHRDIKPENVIFASPARDHVKLIDFGESRILKDGAIGDDSSRITKGTPFFQASESITGRYCPGQLSDVWALGALFYLMLVGHVPFGAGCTSMSELYQAIESEVLVFPQVMNDTAIAALLSGMLNRDLTKRFTLPAVTAHQFFDPHFATVPESHLSPRRSRAARLDPKFRLLQLVQSDSDQSINNGRSAITPRGVDTLSTPSSSGSGTPSKASQTPTAKAPRTPAKNPLSPGFNQLKQKTYKTPTVLNIEAQQVGNPRESSPSTYPASPLSALIATETGAENRKKVLVVEDTHFERVILTKMFTGIAMCSETSPLVVQEMCEGEGAVEAVVQAALAGTPYNLVIVDLFLPGMNGISVITRIREAETQASLCRTPIVLTTTLEERPSNLEEMVDSLSVTTITKPFSPQQVSMMLRWMGVRTISDNKLDSVKEELVRENHVADDHYVCNIAQPGAVVSNPPPCDNRLEMSGFFSSSNNSGGTNPSENAAPFPKSPDVSPTVEKADRQMRRSKSLQAPVHEGSRSADCLREMDESIHGKPSSLARFFSNKVFSDAE